jgi:hypothetical protein
MSVEINGQANNARHACITITPAVKSSQPHVNSLQLTKNCGKDTKMKVELLNLRCTQFSL